MLGCRSTSYSELKAAKRSQRRMVNYFRIIDFFLEKEGTTTSADTSASRVVPSAPLAVLSAGRQELPRKRGLWGSPCSLTLRQPWCSDRSMLWLCGKTVFCGPWGLHSQRLQCQENACEISLLWFSFCSLSSVPALSLTTGERRDYFFPDPRGHLIHAALLKLAWVSSYMVMIIADELQLQILRLNLVCFRCKLTCFLEITFRHRS